MAVDLRRADDRPPRRAVLTLRYLALEVAPPANRAGRGGLPYVALTAILVEEEAPPAGQEAVRWWLVTSLPIRTTADAERAVRYYALRWLVKRLSFRHEVRLPGGEAAIADRGEAGPGGGHVLGGGVAAVVADLREARGIPSSHASGCCRTRSGRCCAAPRVSRRGAPPTLRDAVRRIAGLGGFLGRKGDGEPGVKTLWRGLRRLNDMVAGYELKQIQISCRCAGKE